MNKSVWNTLYIFLLIRSSPTLSSCSKHLKTFQSTLSLLSSLASLLHFNSSLLTVFVHRHFFFITSSLCCPYSFIPQVFTRYVITDTNTLPYNFLPQHLSEQSSSMMSTLVSISKWVRIPPLLSCIHFFSTSTLKFLLRTNPNSLIKLWSSSELSR